MRFIFHIALMVLTVVMHAQDKTHVKRLPLNTESREYGASVYNNGIVFTSNRPLKAMITVVDQNDETFTDLYYFSSDSLQGEPELFSPGLRSKVHDGPITFSTDGKTAYYTRNIYEPEFPKKTKKNNPLGIFKAMLQEGQWVHAGACSFNNEAYNVGQPSLSADGNYLYVASDMPGGYGGTDLYVCERTPQGWSTLQNLGPTVNTSGNEMFPFIEPSGRLYFASDGHPGKGGLDVFYTKGRGSNFRGINAMDSTVNSAADDFAYVVAGLHQSYFSSNRSGTDDIYKRTIAMPDFTTCEPTQSATSCYTFFEETTLEFDSLPLQYEWVISSGETYRGKQADHCFTQPGLYEIELNVIDTIIDRIYMREATYELVVEPPQAPELVIADTVLTDQTVLCNATQTIWSDFTPNRYYWDFGDGMERGTAKMTHSYTDAGNYQVILGLTSAIDTAEQYVKACSFKNVVVLDANSEEGKRFLKRQSSDPTTAFAVPNEPEDQTENIDALEKVYRLELLRSIKKIHPDSFEMLDDTVSERYNREKNLFIYTIGESSNAYSLYDEYTRAQEAGFTASQIVGEEQLVAQILHLNNLGDEYNDNLLNKVIIIDGLLFASNDDHLDDKNKAIVRRVLLLLEKEPGLNIKIMAHTDNQGDANYNKALSLRRADAVKQFLLENGIAAERMTTIGFGDTMPIAPNNTDNGRAQNRRVEFMLIKND